MHNNAVFSFSKRYFRWGFLAWTTDTISNSIWLEKITTQKLPNISNKLEANAARAIVKLVVSRVELTSFSKCMKVFRLTKWYVYGWFSLLLLLNSYYKINHRMFSKAMIWNQNDLTANYSIMAYIYNGNERKGINYFWYLLNLLWTKREDIFLVKQNRWLLYAKLLCQEKKKQ